MSKRARLFKKQLRANRRDLKCHGWCDDDADYYGEDSDGYWCCWRCGGDGYIDGAELADEDPLWYDAKKIYTCNCCGGSGSADDCTYW